MSSRRHSHPSEQASPTTADLTVTLFNLVTHCLVGIAGAVKYFTAISNFLRIAQLYQEMVHLGAADRAHSK